MAMIPIEYTLILSIIIVAIGLYGIFTRRSMIRILIGTELILNAAMLNFVVFSMSNPVFDSNGLMITLFIISMAAAETIIGLILLILLYKDVGGIDISLAKNLKEKIIGKKEIAQEACLDE